MLNCEISLNVNINFERYFWKNRGFLSKNITRNEKATCVPVWKTNSLKAKQGHLYDIVP